MAPSGYATGDSQETWERWQHIEATQRQIAWHAAVERIAEQYKAKPESVLELVHHVRIGGATCCADPGNFGALNMVELILGGFNVWRKLADDLKAMLSSPEFQALTKRIKAALPLKNNPRACLNLNPAYAPHIKARSVECGRGVLIPLARANSRFKMA